MTFHSIGTRSAFKRKLGKSKFLVQNSVCVWERSTSCCRHLFTSVIDLLSIRTSYVYICRKQWEATQEDEYVQPETNSQHSFEENVSNALPPQHKTIDY